MTEPFDVAAGLWWRFDHYEIRDGYIRPALGANLEKYDPWAAYRAGRARAKGAESPYQSLLAMRENVVFQPPCPLSAENEAKVLSWCKDYGLLGVLLQRAQAVVLAPRLEPQDGSQNEHLMPTLRRYFRTNEGWRETLQYIFGKGGYAIVDEAAREGELVSNEDSLSAWPRPHVLLQKLNENKLEEELLTGTWARFFPTISKESRETFSYPIPTSEEFWKLYSEPLDEFLVGASTLRWAIDGLARNKPKATASEGDERSLSRGIKVLHAMVAAVSPTIRPLDDGLFEQRWVAPSLLGSFAMMVLQDLTENNRLLSCEVCGKLFLSVAWQARYCSSKCRHTAQKRRYRAKTKEKNHGQTRSE